MKPITMLILCPHCIREPGFKCDYRGIGNYDEACTTQDYMICPLKGRDDKDVRLGKRTA
jgi:hypothetical protein